MREGREERKGKREGEGREERMGKREWRESKEAT